MTEHYASSSDIARWCGVTRAAVSNWFRRFTDYPAPDVTIGLDGSNAVTHGWRPERKTEWLAWQASDQKTPRRYEPAPSHRAPKPPPEIQAALGILAGAIWPDGVRDAARKAVEDWMTASMEEGNHE